MPTRPRCHGRRCKFKNRRPCIHNLFAFRNQRRALLHLRWCAARISTKRHRHCAHVLGSQARRTTLTIDRSHNSQVPAHSCQSTKRLCGETFCAIRFASGAVRRRFDHRPRIDTRTTTNCELLDHPLVGIAKCRSPRRQRSRVS